MKLVGKPINYVETITGRVASNWYPANGLLEKPPSGYTTVRVLPGQDWWELAIFIRQVAEEERA